MRYNPDTERGIKIEDIADYRTLPAPIPGSRVWSCTNGGWITVEPAPVTDGELESEATLALWTARYKLQQIEPGVVPAATIASLRRDVCDIARELQRLS